MGIAVSLLIGGLLVIASSSPERFDRVFGPTNENQWRVGRSLLRGRQAPYERFVRRRRLAVLLVGALFVLAGGLGALGALLRRF